MCALRIITWSCSTVCNPMDCSPPDSSVHGDSPGKNTGLICHALLQGIFPTKGLNPGLLHCHPLLKVASKEKLERKCHQEIGVNN